MRSIASFIVWALCVCARARRAMARQTLAVVRVWCIHTVEARAASGVLEALEANQVGTCLCTCN